MRPIDADALKCKAQKEATEAWKMKIKANMETVLNQFIDWVDAQPTIEPERKQEKVFLGEIVHLDYDRIQYEKGYTDGIAAKNAGIVCYQHCMWCLDEDEYEHWCNGWGSPARLTGLSDYCSK